MDEKYNEVVINYIIEIVLKMKGFTNKPFFNIIGVRGDSYVR